MSEKTGIKQGAQKEAQTRPFIGGNSQNPRQVELEREMNLRNIEEANARLRSGSITMEEYDRLTGRK